MKIHIDIYIIINNNKKKKGLIIKKKVKIIQNHIYRRILLGENSFSFSFIIDDKNYIGKMMHCIFLLNFCYGKLLFH